MDALQLLTGDPHTFLEKVWGSQAHLHHTDPEALIGLLRVEDVDHLLTSTALRAPALRIAQDGNVLPTSSFTRSATLAGQPLTGLVDGRKVLELFDGGASVVLQGLHRYWPPITELVRQLELELGHPCQANAYLTPAGSQGFALHSDIHDVFVFQTFGHKQWEVHEGDVAREILLEPGLSMYLPTGTPHAARAQEIASLHVTIGINQVSVRSLLRRVAADAIENEKYDGRLPAGYLDNPGTLATVLADGLRQLADDLAAQDTNAQAQREATTFLSNRFPIMSGGLLDRLRLSTISDDTALVRRPTSPCFVSQDGDRLKVLIGDRELIMPTRVAAAMQVIADRTSLTPADLSGHLDAQSRLVLVRRLVREGLLQVAG